MKIEGRIKYTYVRIEYTRMYKSRNICENVCKGNSKSINENSFATLHRLLIYGSPPANLAWI